MGIPDWNKVALRGLFGQMIQTEGLKFRVSIEEWARVTGTSQGYIEIDVEEALENENLEDATMEEIMDALMEHYYEYGMNMIWKRLNLSVSINTKIVIEKYKGTSLPTMVIEELLKK